MSLTASSITPGVRDRIDAAVRSAPIAPATIVVAALTALAFVLRLSQIHQSLYADELFTLADLQRRSLGAVVTTVNTGGENSPPLFFVLAWMAEKLGDPTVWIRLPSLLFGTAAVPIVYWLGRETVGRAAGLFGAALIALSPFAVYYGVEARPYATLTFFVALSTLALVRAIRTRSAWWWSAYVVAAAAAAYTHYTGIFVLAVQAAWSLWVSRDRLREPLIANAVVALLYLPWLPNLRGKALGVIGGLYPLGPGVAVKDTLRFLIGYPASGLKAIPTLFGLAVIGASVLAGLAATVLRWHRAPSVAPRRLDFSSPPVLIAMLAVATPIGLLLYSVLVTDLWLPRGLSASLPAAALILGWVLSRLPPRWTAVTAAAVLLTLGAGTLKSFGADYQREPYGEMAAYLDRAAGPRDPVIMVSLIGGVAIPALEHKPHVIVKLTANVWRLVPAGGSAYLVLGDQEAQRLELATPHPTGFRLVAHIHYPGSLPTELLVYRRE